MLEVFNMELIKSKTFENLKDIAIVESIKGSNAIEGIVTSDARLKDYISSLKTIL